MPNSRPIAQLDTVLGAVSAVLILMTTGLLVGGSLTDHTALLTWGAVAGVVTVDLLVVCVVKCMIDDAVRRCVEAVACVVQGHVDDAVEDTAVRVGSAIAEALGDDHPDAEPGSGVTPIYTR